MSSFQGLFSLRKKKRRDPCFFDPNPFNVNGSIRFENSEKVLFKGS